MGWDGVEVAPGLGDGPELGFTGLGSGGLFLVVMAVAAAAALGEDSQRDLRLEAEEEEDGLWGGPLG